MSHHVAPIFEREPDRRWVDAFAPSVYINAAGEPRWLLATLAAGEPCVDLVRVTMVWPQRATLRNVQLAPAPGSLTDIDGDDVPELLTADAIYRWSKGGSWQTIATLPRRDLDSPC